MTWNPGKKYEMYLSRISGLLGDEKRTVRDVYYALESRGFPAELAEEGYDFEYRYVKRAVKKGRRHGYIDPAKIVDTSRAAENTVTEGYESPEQFVEDRVEGIWNYYGRNFWADQDHYVEVWLEKQSLASVFEPICSEHNIRLEALRGDWSDSKVYEAAQRLLDQLRDGKDVRVIHYGDFNPSGYHAPVAVQNTMDHYGLQLPYRGARAEEYPLDNDGLYFDIWPVDGPSEADFGEGGTIMFERGGINLEHIKEYDLPENPSPSSTDKDRELRERFMTWVSDGRDVNIELNALKEYHREDLEEMVEDDITQYIDSEKREQTKQEVTNERKRIARSVVVNKDKL